MQTREGLHAVVVSEVLKSIFFRRIGFHCRLRCLRCFCTLRCVRLHDDQPPFTVLWVTTRRRTASGVAATVDEVRVLPIVNGVVLFLVVSLSRTCGRINNALPHRCEKSTHLAKDDEKQDDDDTLLILSQ